MNIDKNVLKRDAVSLIKGPIEPRRARRIETIVRAGINHLSYELNFGIVVGDKPSIYLLNKQTGKVIIIERNPDTSKGPMSFYTEPWFWYKISGYPYQCAFEIAHIILEKVKGNLAKEKTTETDDAKSAVCAD